MYTPDLRTDCSFLSSHSGQWNWHNSFATENQELARTSCIRSEASNKHFISATSCMSFSYFPSVLRYGILVDETVKSEEHRQRFPSPCFETYFKKKCDRRFSFFSLPSFLSYPQILSSNRINLDVCLKLRNQHAPKNPLKELFARMFVRSPRHDFSVPGWWGPRLPCWVPRPSKNMM